MVTDKFHRSSLSLQGLNEKILYKGWLPVDDELDDSSEKESRLHLEAIVAMVAIPREAMVDAWSGILSGLYALGVAIQSAHWRSLGESFYGDHLMYQRMYEDVIREIDSFAERFMGVIGDETALDPAHLLSHASVVVKQMMMPGDLASALLMAEKNFLERLGGFAKTLESTGQLSTGIENLIQGISDRHEEHVYLLSRRLSQCIGKEALKAVIRTA